MFIYHIVPWNLEGRILYPLNELRTVLPHLYAQYIKNYENRPKVLKQWIPTLDCLWNDVLFLSPVHPQAVRLAYAEAGATLIPDLRCFKIDPAHLEPEKTSVWIPRTRDGHSEEFRAYDPSSLEQYSTLSEDTVPYFREEFAKGKKPLLFLRVPHILYRGTLDISGVTIIEP